MNVTNITNYLFWVVQEGSVAVYCNSPDKADPKDFGAETDFAIKEVIPLFVFRNDKVYMYVGNLSFEDEELTVLQLQYPANFFKGEYFDPDGN